MDSLASYLPYLTISVIVHLGLPSLFLASDFSTGFCNWILPLHYIISHLFSSEKRLHTGTEDFFLFECKKMKA